MKKIYSYAMMLLAGTLAITACSDDNESNPTLVQPTEFQINSVSVPSALIDLQHSESFTMTWSLPTFTDYGAPVVPTYEVQVSPTGSYNKEFDFDGNENEGADFFTINQTFNSTQGDINTEVLDQELQQFLGWSVAEDVPAALPLTLRVKAYVRDASFTEYSTILSSNTQTITTAPYFNISVDPQVWYLVGAGIGSADWSNDAGSVGVGLIPLLPSGDEEYDKATGTGIISYTGFMKSGTQFKLIYTPGDWNTQCNFENVKDADGDLISDEDGDNHNIGIKGDGYYTISMDTKKKELTIVKYEKSPKVFTAMAMPGTQNGWDAAGGNVMSACETSNGENHIWMTQFNVDEDGEVKFAADGGWDNNWGSATFPYGTGINGGSNIPFVAGSYTVFLNDITGQFMFIENQ